MQHIDRTSNHMRKKILFVLIALVILLIPIYFLVKRTIAIEYQKESIDLFYAISGNLEPDKEKAIEKIDIAIRLAPKNYLFYVTKADMLLKLDKYHDAINELQKIEKFKDDYAEGYMSQGMIYDFLELHDSALFQYNKALDSYNLKIDEYKENVDSQTYLEMNRLFVFILLNDSIIATNEYNRLRLKYPGNPVLENLKDLDKERIIQEMYIN